MAHYPLVHSPDFKAVPMTKVIDHNPRVFSLGTLNQAHCLRLVERMKTGAPDLYKTLHTDPMVKTLITKFNADIIIPMKVKP